MKVTVKIEFEIDGSKEMKKSLVERIKEQIIGDNGRIRLFDCTGFDKENKPYSIKVLKMKVKKKGK